MRAKDDFTNFLQDKIEGMAQSHLEGWKSRYLGYTVKDLKIDLEVNHDPSIEIEYAEEKLGRKLLDDERKYLVKKFNKAVAKQYIILRRNR